MSEPAATRALLEALSLDVRQAAAILGISEADMAGLVVGHLRVDGPQERWDAKMQRHRGAWCEMAEALCAAVLQTAECPASTPHAA